MAALLELLHQPRRRDWDLDHRVEAGRGPPDDQLLNLGRPLVERRHARVAQVALYGVVVHVARAAVHLDRQIRVADRGLREGILIALLRDTETATKPASISAA